MPPQGLMFGQFMPGGEDQMLAFRDAQRVIDVLLLNGDGGDILVWRDLFFPFRGCGLDG